MKKISLLMTTGLLALFAAGCGDDEESGDNAGSAARGYAETGQAVSDICRRANAEINPISAKANGKADNDAPLLEQVVEANEKYIAEVKEITPDPKLQDSFDGFVSALEQAQSEADEALSAAQSGDQSAYDEALEELSGMEDASKPFARALGASECNKD